MRQLTNRLKLGTVLLVLVCLAGNGLLSPTPQAASQTRPNTKPSADTKAAREGAMYWLKELKNNKSYLPDLAVASLVQQALAANMTLEDFNTNAIQLEAWRVQNHERLAQEAYQDLLSKTRWSYDSPGYEFHALRCSLAKAHRTLSDLSTTEEQLAYTRRLAHARKAAELWCKYQRTRDEQTLLSYRQELQFSTGDFGKDSPCESALNLAQAKWVPWIISEEKLLCPFTQEKDPLLGTEKQRELPPIYQAALQGKPSPCPGNQLVAKGPFKILPGKPIHADIVPIPDCPANQ